MNGKIEFQHITCNFICYLVVIDIPRFNGSVDTARTSAIGTLELCFPPKNRGSLEKKNWEKGADPTSKESGVARQSSVVLRHFGHEEFSVIVLHCDSWAMTVGRTYFEAGTSAEKKPRRSWKSLKKTIISHFMIL